MLITYQQIENQLEKRTFYGMLNQSKPKKKINKTMARKRLDEVTS